jgi:hypothetical protein
MPNARVTAMNACAVPPTASSKEWFEPAHRSAARCVEPVPRALASLLVFAFINLAAPRVIRIPSEHVPGRTHRVATAALARSEATRA